jgi:hypothetical protein
MINAMEGSDEMPSCPFCGGKLRVLNLNALFQEDRYYCDNCDTNTDGIDRDISGNPLKTTEDVDSPHSRKFSQLGTSDIRDIKKGGEGE